MYVRSYVRGRTSGKYPLRFRSSSCMCAYVRLYIIPIRSQSLMSAHFRSLSNKTFLHTVRAHGHKSTNNSSRNPSSMTSLVIRTVGTPDLLSVGTSYSCLKESLTPIWGSFVPSSRGNLMTPYDIYIYLTLHKFFDERILLRFFLHDAFHINVRQRNQKLILHQIIDAYPRISLLIKGCQLIRNCMCDVSH